MAKIISIAMQKGGVGKTTSTYNLAALYAKDGNKVLCIDSDSQCSLTLMMGYDPLSFDHNLATIINDEDDIRNCIYNTKIENLYFVPGSPKLALSDMKLLTKTFGRDKVMKKSIDKISDDYDYIFIDCLPSLGMLPINALTASDYVITPCETTKLSAFSLDDLQNTIDGVKEESNPNLKQLGIIATKFVSNSNNAKEVVNDLKEEYNVLGVIKATASATDGIDDGLPSVITSDKSLAGTGYKETYENIKKEIEKYGN